MASAAAAVFTFNVGTKVTCTGPKKLIGKTGEVTKVIEPGKLFEIKIQNEDMSFSLYKIHPKHLQLVSDPAFDGDFQSSEEVVKEDFEAVFEVGTQVVIDGLKSKPELNGETGVVVGETIDSKGEKRFTIKVQTKDGKTSEYSLLPKCLRELPTEFIVNSDETEDVDVVYDALHYKQFLEIAELKAQILALTTENAKLRVLRPSAPVFKPLTE